MEEALVNPDTIKTEDVRPDLADHPFGRRTGLGSHAAGMLADGCRRPVERDFTGWDRGQERLDARLGLGGDPLEQSEEVSEDDGDGRAVDPGAVVDRAQEEPLVGGGEQGQRVARPGADGAGAGSRPTPTRAVGRGGSRDVLENEHALVEGSVPGSSLQP